MSAQPMPVTQVRINLMRGIVSLIGQAAARIPHGQEVWDGGLKEVVAQALQDMGVPTEELTVVGAAQQLGILKTAKRRKHFGIYDFRQRRKK